MSEIFLAILLSVIGIFLLFYLVYAVISDTEKYNDPWPHLKYKEKSSND